MPKVALTLATVAIATMMAAMTPAAVRSQSSPAGLAGGSLIHAGDSHVLVTEASGQAKKRVVVKKRVVKKTVVARPVARKRVVVRTPAVRTQGAYAAVSRTCRTVTVRKRVGGRVVVSKTRRCI
jgi:hypothetical protein